MPTSTGQSVLPCKETNLNCDLPVKKSTRVFLWLLFGVMGLTILVQACCFYRYRMAVTQGFRDGVWGMWYYVQPGSAIGFASYDFGSVDYPIYQDDLWRLKEMLREEWPDHMIILENPADMCSVYPFILSPADKPPLSYEEHSRILDIVREWQAGIMNTRSPRTLPEATPASAPQP